MPSRLNYIEIENFRSIHNKIHIDFPKASPLILIGENNAGKSNIMRALDLLLGESWAGNHEPDDHEFWERNPQSGAISIKVGLSGVRGNNGYVNGISWKYQHGGNGAEYKLSDNSFVNKKILDQCTVVMIGADRRLSYQMSYTNKWTLLSKLMKRFHKRLVDDPDRVKRLKEKFSEIKKIFEEVTEFASFQTGLQNQFASMLEGMTYRLLLDFSAYDPSNYFQSLRVLPVEGMETRNLEELGTGEEQVLALAFAHAYAKTFHGGIVLAIEEPEAHLHPLAQLWLSRKIQEFTNDGLQVILTTHSPAFVNLMGLDGIVLVRKETNSTQIVQVNAKSLAEFCILYGSDGARTTENTILPFYAKHGTYEILSGLFAKRVILVEGQTEQFALKIYLEKVGLDVEKSGIAIVPVMGKGNLAKWWRFFSAYGIPNYVIFDNDNEHDSKGDQRKDLLSTLEVQGADKIISETDWFIHENFSVFGIDFEKTMRKVFSDYKKIEEEAINMLGPSKPIVARYVAEQIEIPAGSQEFIKFNELKDKILSAKLSIPTTLNNQTGKEETKQAVKIDDNFDMSPPDFPDDWGFDEPPF
ncbi:MAG: AAA family ATPase [Anaerolineales bacterium]|nr:MAG: AAA family ATPase [Anaerolineales bacterium]